MPERTAHQGPAWRNQHGRGELSSQEVLWPRRRKKIHGIQGHSAQSLDTIWETSGTKHQKTATQEVAPAAEPGVIPWSCGLTHGSTPRYSRVCWRSLSICGCPKWSRSWAEMTQVYPYNWNVHSFLNFTFSFSFIFFSKSKKLIPDPCVISSPRLSPLKI